MMESRNSYGWGYVGTDQRGYEWHFQPDENDPCFVEGNYFVGTVGSGEVFTTPEKAIAAGKEWLSSTQGSRHQRSGSISAVKSEPIHFEY